MKFTSLTHQLDTIRKASKGTATAEELSALDIQVDEDTRSICDQCGENPIMLLLTCPVVVDEKKLCEKCFANLSDS